MSIIADHLTNKEIMSLVGSRLRQRRLERNKTVDELAAHAGVNRKTILSLESGKDITFSSLIKILRSMNMLGVLEAAIPDRLPGNEALTGSSKLRIRASRPRIPANKLPAPVSSGTVTAFGSPTHASKNKGKKVARG